MQHYKPYNGRSHTKKLYNKCKPKLSAALKQKRKEAKAISKLFPNWKCNKHLFKANKNYQHTTSNLKTRAV